MLTESSGERTPGARHRAGVASMAWRSCIDAPRQFDLCTARRVEHDEIGLLGELGRPVRLRELLDVAGAAAAGEHVVVAGQREGRQQQQCGCDRMCNWLLAMQSCLFVSLSM